MQIKICDKCKNQYGTFPEQAVRFPIVKMNITRNYTDCVHNDENSKVDLCSNCQKAVYDFIFGKEDEEDVQRQ